MDILGSWPIKNHVLLPERYTGPLIPEGYRVEIKDQPAENNARVDVFDYNGNKVYSGHVAYHDPSKKDSIHGIISVLASGIDCYISAYTRSGIDYDYIFGFATTKIPAADSGGQWDGNRPR